MKQCQEEFERFLSLEISDYANPPRPPLEKPACRQAGGGGGIRVYSPR